MMSGKEQYAFFRKKLLKWNKNENNRQMPWKGETDPYKVWLSEVVLQQTRVEQGLNYYNKFIKHFPNVHQLASASEEKVYKLWEGLGYYNRCKNLIETAHLISNNLKGVFPNTYESILKLKGVGEYTASAISSFAFKLPYAVVDGNVYRVLSRFFGIEKEFISSKDKKFFKELAQELLDSKNPGLYNQAIMDFGATICTAQKPKCSTCLLKENCYAFKNNKQAALPIKKIKAKTKELHFNYFVFSYRNKTAIKQRSEKNIWNKLFEFYLVETKNNFSKKKAQDFLLQNFPEMNYLKIEISKQNIQKLTHRKVFAVFIKVELESKFQLNKDFKWVSLNEMALYSFPRIIRDYIQ